MNKTSFQLLAAAYLALAAMSTPAMSQPAASDASSELDHDCGPSQMVFGFVSVIG
jgi:hypothetical protein